MPWWSKNCRRAWTTILFESLRARPRLQIALAALAGGANVLSFAPFGWWPLQILLLVLLFAAVLHSTAVRRSALIGWAFGFGWYAVGVAWLFVSLHRFGNLPAPLAVLAVGLLALFLGLFVGLATGLATWLQRRFAILPAAMLLMLLPALLTLADWTRSWIFTGFPWIVTGYAHTDSPLAGFAPIVGVYGLGWLAALLAGSLLLARSQRRLMALPALLPIMLLVAGAALQGMAWTTPVGQPISVRLIQGNVPQEMKFDIERINETLMLYHDLIREQKADLIATPETAIPLLSRFLPADYLPRLAQFSQESGSHVALGMPISDGPDKYANSVLGLRPDGLAYRFDKQHLVPFGEFVPPGFRWFVDMMRIPLGDFTRGAAIQPALAVKDQWVLPNICYEDLFGEEIAAQLRESAHPATILLNVSNIAWFGDSIALPQHLQISRMRALETGRPMLRATNTGSTAVIDARGKVVAELAPYTRGTLAASVQGHEGMTPFILFGNRFIVILCLLLLACGIFLRRKATPIPPNTKVPNLTIL